MAEREKMLAGAGVDEVREGAGSGGTLNPQAGGGKKKIKKQMMLSFADDE